MELLTARFSLEHIPLQPYGSSGTKTLLKCAFSASCPRHKQDCMGSVECRETLGEVLESSDGMKIERYSYFQCVSSPGLLPLYCPECGVAFRVVDSVIQKLHVLAAEYVLEEKTHGAAHT